jgi:DNA-directed RNA polymerase specialized sigma24 family protein
MIEYAVPEEDEEDNPPNHQETTMEKRPNRSDACQHLFHEISFSQDMLSTFRNDDSILSRLCPHQYDERLLDLDDQLRQEFWRVVGEALSDKQKKIIELIGKEGYTQQETAKVMGCNQSSIAKALHGNNSGDSVYGGIYKKLRDAVFADEKILAILQEMPEIKEERW